MAKPAYYSLNKIGTSGPDVGLIQKWINGVRTKWPGIIALTVDGKFGANTDRAVKQFQTITGLKVDGKVGTNTWNELHSNYSALFSVDEQYPGVYIKNGTRGATVKSAQDRLASKGYPLVADGIFGAKTLAATKAFQLVSGLSSDGIIGSKTWAKLYS